MLGKDTAGRVLVIRPQATDEKTFEKMFGLVLLGFGYTGLILPWLMTFLPWETTFREYDQQFPCLIPMDRSKRPHAAHLTFNLVSCDGVLISKV